MEAVASGRVGLEQLAHDTGAWLVHDDGAKPWLVQVSDGRFTGVLAAPELLADAAFHVFRQIVHRVLRHAQRNAEDELPLGCILKPKRGEPKATQHARIEQVDDFASLDAVPREPVGVP